MALAASGPASVLALQQAIGNQAVARLVRRQQIQRQPPSEPRFVAPDPDPELPCRTDRCVAVKPVYHSGVRPERA